MRTLVFLVITFTLCGCSALMVGGGNSAGGSTYKSSGNTATQTDASLAAAVKTSLASDSRINMFDITTRASAGKVTLSGIVDTYAARERAEKIAIGFDGVAAVDNQIKVQD